MPVTWHVLFWIHHLNETWGLNLCLAEIGSVYELQTFGYSLVVLKVKTVSSHLVLKSSHTYHDWKERYFFVKTISLGQDIPPKDWLTEG